MKLIFNSLLISLTATSFIHAKLVAGDKKLGTIWCVGDSITQSNADQDPTGSARSALYEKLKAAGYEFTFTGSYNADSEGLPQDENYTFHSGYSGSVVSNAPAGSPRVDMSKGLLGDGCKSGVNNMWSMGKLATSKPNLVLVMLGTNDVDAIPLTHRKPAEIAIDLSLLIKKIQSLSPTKPLSFIVSTIAPNRTQPEDPKNTSEYNQELVKMVASLKQQNLDIVLVDTFADLEKNYDQAMTNDNLHPNRLGNGIIADNWIKGISQLTGLQK